LASAAVGAFPAQDNFGAVTAYYCRNQTTAPAVRRRCGLSGCAPGGRWPGFQPA
jgi:hypothetical protein